MEINYDTLISGGAMRYSGCTFGVMSNEAAKKHLGVDTTDAKPGTVYAMTPKVCAFIEPERLP